MTRAVLLGTLLFARAGLACSCVGFLTLLSPRHGSTGVPLNAQLRFVALKPVTFTLTDEGGVAVPAVLVHQKGVSVIRPDNLLRPLTRYNLTLTATHGDTAGTTFTTGSAEDHTPPSLGGVPMVEHGADPMSSCGPSEVFVLTWPAQADDVTPPSQLVMEGVLAASNTVGSAEPDVASMEKLFVQSGFCGGTSNIVNMDTAFVRTRAVDWAGNASEFTPTLLLKGDAGAEPAERGGCGCTTAEGALVLAALGLVLRKRSCARSR